MLNMSDIYYLLGKHILNNSGTGNTEANDCVCYIVGKLAYDCYFAHLPKDFFW